MIWARAASFRQNGMILGMRILLTSVVEVLDLYMRVMCIGSDVGSGPGYAYGLDGLIDRTALLDPRCSGRGVSGS